MKRDTIVSPKIKFRAVRIRQNEGLIATIFSVIFIL
jgi:hypothetical protein